MLNEHRQQLGVHFAQDAPGLLAPPLVELPVALPQLEEEFDLPAGAE